MTRLRFPALLLFAALGCGHAHDTDKQTASPSQPPTPAKATNRVHADHAAKPRDDEPAATPLASSAGGLLEPGAEKKIRDRLAADGFLEKQAGDERRGSLDAALKRFQDAHDLPATGAPDAETVRKLGLDPDEIFRKAAKPPS